MRISDWCSDVCSSGLHCCRKCGFVAVRRRPRHRAAYGWCGRAADVHYWNLVSSFTCFRMDDLPLAPSKTAHLRFCELRSEEHTSELQSLMRISYADFCLKQKKT